MLGVVRPTVEKVGELTRTGHIGVFGTPGTIASRSYNIEIEGTYPSFKVHGHACPMWVPLVENRESNGDGADYFVKKDIDLLMSECPDIDTVILGCTHYPLLIDKIHNYMPHGIQIIQQGPIVADSLADYLQRHPEIEQHCSRGGTCRYYTTSPRWRASSSTSRSTPNASCCKSINHDIKTTWRQQFVVPMLC